jgi:hypothetical protein
MKQLLAIFCKDARRSRTHIAIVAALTALLAVLTPRYEPMFTSHTADLNRAIDILQFLLPVTWWAAIAHVVHAEPLAGDRAYWFTRPYSRFTLFGAKLLFCAAFILAPFLLSDCAIVYAEGFSPVALFRGLLSRQAVAGAVLLMPALIVAALTRSMRQFVLALLGVAVALILLVPLAAHQGNYAIDALAARSSPVQAWFERWGFALWCAVTAGLLLWIYASRRIAIARGLVIGGAALVFLSSLSTSRAVTRLAPIADRHREIAVAFAPQRGTAGIPPTDAGKVQIDLPVEFSGRDRDLLDWAVVQTSITTPAGGAPWKGPWSAMARTEPAGAIELHLDAVDYDRLRRGPVRIGVVLGVTLYERTESVRVARAGGWMAVPGVGAVSLRNDSPWSYLLWRMPFRYAAERLVYRFYGPDPAAPFHTQSSNGHPISDLFHISPIVQWIVMVNPPKPRVVRSATIDVEREIDFLRRDLVIPDVRLSDWVVAN